MTGIGRVSVLHQRKKRDLELGYQSSLNIESGLSRTVEWTRQNMELIAAQINKHQVHLRRINNG